MADQEEPCVPDNQFTPKDGLIRTPRYVGDLTTKDFSSPRKAKRNLDFVKNVVNDKSKKIRLLSIEKTRLEARISSLAELLSELSAHRLLSDEGVAAIMV